MQIPQHLVSNQIVSLKAYRCLRDSLVQQSHRFDSVLTDTQWANTQASELSQALIARSSVQFVVMQSSGLSALLLAVATTEDHNHPSVSTAKDERQYRLRLSFDSEIIADFVQHLATGAIASWALTESVPSSTIPTTANVTASVTSESTGSLQSDQVEPFVLAWTKTLATLLDDVPQPKESPSEKRQLKKNELEKNTIQTTLDTKIQQSLLLNQVITRIRHSLDLPDILETTVAQVREFLGADRLVLYQFEQLDLVDDAFTSSDSTRSTAENTTVVRQDSRHEARSLHLSGQLPSRLSKPDNSGGPIVGQHIHRGHVTYESRISEEISSVLNYAENFCFQPSLTIHDRYILGQPIAIDDVEAQYSHAACLLDFLRKASVKSKIIAPIIVQDQLWGLLIAHQCDRPRHWEETEGLFLQHIAEHLAVAISQAALYHQLREQTVSLESCVVERTQNLHDALIAAESANLTKGEFLSTMSHELRTPLTYIIGMSATLLRWSFGNLSDRQRSYLNTINHSGEQLLTIINDILEFAKIESGRSLLDFSDFSLTELIEGIVSHYRELADKQGVQVVLSMDIGADHDQFRSDAKKLEQILSNLIHNAIKFTPAEGCVNVRIWQDAQTTLFEVSDTGIGIPESQRDLLFEKFKQLESPFQRQYSGTGLGLAMTKRLVELHGGSIQVDSTVGEGSTFTVRLPLQTTTLNQTKYEVPPTETRSNRVLLFEVEEVSAAIICDLLTADGYEVIWLVEADQLLSQLSSLQPAMLIADLSLLSHDSDDVKSIQLSITAMGAKVLALLGQPVSHSSHIAHHDTLDKPIDPRKLLEKVRQLTM